MGLFRDDGRGFLSRSQNVCNARSVPWCPVQAAMTCLGVALHDCDRFFRLPLGDTPASRLRHHYGWPDSGIKLSHCSTWRAAHIRHPITVCGPRHGGMARSRPRVLSHYSHDVLGSLCLPAVGSRDMTRATCELCCRTIHPDVRYRITGRGPRRGASDLVPAARAWCRQLLLSACLTRSSLRRSRCIRWPWALLAGDVRICNTYSYTINPKVRCLITGGEPRHGGTEYGPALKTFLLPPAGFIFIKPAR